MNRIQLEIWILKAILMRLQTEMRTSLLETEEKVILFIKWQRPWLNYVPEFCGRLSLQMKKSDI